MPHPSRTRLVPLAGALLAACALGAAPAAAHAPQRHAATLNPVPHDPATDGGSNVTGDAKLALRGNQLRVVLRAAGVTPNLPHAVHIHGKDAGELSFCLGANRRDDITDDGLIETAEGIDDYGPVQVSFTLFGDTSAASVLALDRFPTGKASGKLRYQRRIEIPAGVADNLDEKHIVVHGDDINRDGMYNGPTSALGVPIEAELPAACGEIHVRR